MKITVSHTGSAAAEVAAAAPPVDVADDSLIPGLMSAPVVSDTELLLSSLDGGCTAASPRPGPGEATVT